MKRITYHEAFDGSPMFTIHTRVTMHMIRMNHLRRMLIPAIVLSIGASTGFAQSSSPAMSAEEIAAHVKYLSSDELGQVLTGHFYRDVANVFVDLANDRGGDDNVTCLVVYAGNDK